ncbi:phosphohistidine phosphatase [Palleronia marisminoris]|uniref:Histidine phosphatase superfamily (Branch 1) n=1 Tax=Palleronia marisminoris TaxID=315423 RepID=A0A1Y5T9U9_9RHOB|nr:histidine phosphatase family protein [Palleronia marisminoris]SFH16714.1 phosphohistidine phosphatase [Palleronia marisminoris]SLN55628.1 Histidine phosphatase superfamily (branch 1) [Palleronia marisminoris]
MSRRLILTRHAKSAWDHPDLDDHDRPLTRRGERSATAIGRWLSENDHRPEVALLSTARRVVETWAGIGPRLCAAPNAVRDRALYHSSPETMLAALVGRPEACVILIAHNPGMATLAQRLVRTTPDRGEFAYFPTCATLILDFEVASWGDVAPREGHVVDFVVPRDLTD